MDSSDRQIAKLINKSPFIKKGKRSYLLKMLTNLSSIEKKKLLKTLEMLYEEYISFLGRKSLKDISEINSSFIEMKKQCIKKLVTEVEKDEKDQNEDDFAVKLSSI